MSVDSKHPGHLFTLGRHHGGVIWAFSGKVVLAAVAGIAVALSLVWLVPGVKMDFTFDWLSTRAFVRGGDPFAPIAELLAHTGVESHLASQFDGVDIYHPRTPGAVVLLSPLAAVPWDAAYEVGRILVVLSAAFLIWICARAAAVNPNLMLLFLPIVMVMWPFSAALRSGNTGILVAALVALSWFSRDSVLAGVRSAF